MTDLISNTFIRPLKILLVGIALAGALANIPHETSLANTKKPKISRIARTINTLKTSNTSWIQVDLSKQRLIAWRGNKAVYAVIISTGKKATPTPTGIFQVQTKLTKTRMKGEDYDIPDVPHTMYYQGDYAIHGAYWHRRFGTPVSRGCVNVAPNHAKWLYKWASVGTTVVVHK